MAKKGAIQLKLGVRDGKAFVRVYTKPRRGVPKKLAHADLVPGTDIKEVVEKLLIETGYQDTKE